MEAVENNINIGHVGNNAIFQAEDGALFYLPDPYKHVQIGEPVADAYLKDIGGLTALERMMAEELANGG